MFKSNTGQCSMLRYYLLFYKISASVHIQRSELQDNAISADLWKHSLVFRIQKYESLISILKNSVTVKAQL